MKHYASPDFWTCFEVLPDPIKELARKNYELLKANPHHPSLHLKLIDPFVSAFITVLWELMSKMAYSGFGSGRTRIMISFCVKQLFALQKSIINENSNRGGPHRLAKKRRVTAALARNQMKIIHQFFSNNDDRFKALVDKLRIPHEFSDDIAGEIVSFRISETDDA